MHRDLRFVPEECLIEATRRRRTRDGEGRESSAELDSHGGREKLQTALLLRVFVDRRVKIAGVLDAAPDPSSRPEDPILENSGGPRPSLSPNCFYRAELQYRRRSVSGHFQSPGCISVATELRGCLRQYS